MSSKKAKLKEKEKVNKLKKEFRRLEDELANLKDDVKVDSELFSSWHVILWQASFLCYIFFVNMYLCLTFKYLPNILMNYSHVNQSFP